MTKTIAGTSLLTLLFAAGALASVSVDHDKSVDFSRYKTFTLAEGTPAVDPVMRQRILDAIADGLATKGLEKVDEGADLRVVVHVSTAEEIRISDEGFTYGGHVGWDGWHGWGPTSVNLSVVATGTLMLDMVDTASNELVWRGIASDTIPRKAAKKRKTIQKAVNKLFRDFPPRPKQGAR